MNCNWSASSSASKTGKGKGKENNLFSIFSRKSVFYRLFLTPNANLSVRWKCSSQIAGKAEGSDLSSGGSSSHSSNAHWPLCDVPHNTGMSLKSAVAPLHQFRCAVYSCRLDSYTAESSSVSINVENGVV